MQTEIALLFRQLQRRGQFGRGDRQVIVPKLEKAEHEVGGRQVILHLRFLIDGKGALRIGDGGVCCHTAVAAKRQLPAPLKEGGLLTGGPMLLNNGL